MIKTKIIEVKWHNTNKKYYVGKGYVFTEYGEPFQIDVNDLPIHSPLKVEVECDYCGEPHHKSYASVIKGRKHIQKDCCSKCKSKKVAESNLKIYGVENTFQLDSTKEKSQKTQITRYGTLYSKTDERKERIKQTNLEKYGVETPLQNKKVMEKLKKTNLERYGVENVFQNEEIQTRYIKSIQDKYNNPNLKNITGLKFIQDKIKQTSLLKYGVEYPFQAEEVKNKIKTTNLERYGVEFSMQNKEIREKAMKTLYENGSVPTSSQQIEVYHLLKEKGYNVELNYPLSKVCLDIALFINGHKVDIEYDCEYWHDAHKDRKRDEFVKSQGWKVIRIIAGRKIPTADELIEKINNLDEYNFQSIVLEDWNDKYYE